MKRYSIILTLFIGILTGCTPSPEKYSFSGDTMGTTYHVVLVTKGKVDEKSLQKSLDERLLALNKHLSNWDKTSEISSFNALRTLEPFKMSPMLSKVMQNANRVHQKSEGYFDVTASPVINLWGFGPGHANAEIPSEEDIQSALQKVGQSDKLQLNESELMKHNPQIEINLSAIAKGFAVDELSRLLSRMGFENFMVEIGGDLFAQGTNIKGEPWHIGVESPNALGKVEQLVTLSHQGMATSGDYRNFFQEDGTRYSHLIDPKTGRPVRHNTTSVTVIAENAMLADAWATALLVMGEEKGMVMAEQHNIAAAFITYHKEDEDKMLRTSKSTAFQKLK